MKSLLLVLCVPTLVLAFGLFGCATSPPTPVETPPPAGPISRSSPAPPPKGDVAPPLVSLQPASEVARRNLLGADLAFSRICEEQGAPEGFYQCLASNAVCLLAGEPPVEGRDTIKIHLAAGPQGTLAWKPRAAELGPSGDLGYTWGTCEFRGRNPDNQPQMIYSKYVIIWKKQPDGIWRAQLFATSPNPPPSARKP